MEKYSFVVKSNNSVIIDLIIEDLENIDVNDDKYIIKFDEKGITFIKENVETSFRLIYECNTYNALLTLKETNHTMNIPIENIDYNMARDGFVLTYKLESQEYPLEISLKMCK